jgi:hypothetical protein
LQTIALTPHAIVTDGRTVFLIMAGNLHAARAWPASPVPHDSSDTKQRYVFDPRSSWTWLVVTNIKGWETIPSKWVANDHNADVYGYVAAEAMSDPVPAVISIFLQRGYRRITDTLKRQFEATYDIDGKCEKMMQSGIFLRRCLLAMRISTGT